jgi:hypothetical protein
MLQVRRVDILNNNKAMSGYWQPAADSTSIVINCFFKKQEALVQRTNNYLETITAFWVPTKKEEGIFAVQ